MDYREEAKRFLTYMPKFHGAEHKEEIEKISKGECNLLVTLFQSEGVCAAGELAKSMEVSTARVTAIINSLEKKDFVSRKAVEGDKRKTNVILTEKGKKKVKEMFEHALNGMTAYFEFLGEEEVKHLFHLMDLSLEFHKNMENKLKENQRK